ncbi:DUF1240 domain-containing protein [Serratia microhaemolytica]|uniref:DUF1240 domain-containing protein n=1 Tax=Serratia microhaemolytica TaxID=2675110 RepID=UPI0013923509|nr:DUF1240 domain-containing protein [Serratia microhaemolytica]
MAKINRLFVILYAILFLAAGLAGAFVSLDSYWAFFRLADRVEFSSMIGMFVFGVPILLYLSILCFLMAYKNQPIRMSNKLSKSLTILFAMGVIIGISSSVYVNHSLSNKGYIICDKISWMSPNQYVNNSKLCQ